MTPIARLLCEYRKNPVGIDVTTPRLSWRMVTDRPGARQVAYRVIAASSPNELDADHGDLWDSGRVESSESVHIVYAGAPLASRQIVYWRVIVWDETGDANTSEIATFEIGLLDRGEWAAEWIGAALYGGARSMIPAPYLRRAFDVDQSILSARLYITALGVYECTINGQRVGDDVFAPGWTDYRTRLQYNVYDVTALLQHGENAIGIILGDGWAVGHTSWNDRQAYFERPQAFAQLEITLVDGEKQIIPTNEAWRYQYGAILHNDMIMGEAYDARREMPGWDKPGFDDSDWDCALVMDAHDMALVATNGPTMKRMEFLHPVADPTVHGRHERKRYVYDLGQNMVGRVIFKGVAPAGTTVTLRFAEVLNPDGTMYITNLRSAKATDYYTFKGDGEEVWESKFTFHGFRYVEIFGYPYPNVPRRDAITGVALYSEMAETGTFESSAPDLNQLQSNIVWGQKGNFLDVPTDCPQRDERVGWTGDIQVFIRTAAFNMDIAAFMSKWLQDLLDAQSPEGVVPNYAPHPVGNRRDAGPAWADAMVICPYTLYLTYGDRRILERTYDGMTRFMGFLKRTSPDFIRCAPDYEGWQGYGDWLSINADTPRDFIGTAFYAYDADLMRRIALVLGKVDDAAMYAQLHADIKAAFASRYLMGSIVTAAERSEAVRQMMRDADFISRGSLTAVDYGVVESDVFNTNLFQPTQTSYALALVFDLLPEELRPQAARELVADIERRDMHLSTGFVGAPYLPHALSLHDQLDAAYTLLLQRTCPSWLYPVTVGATTIWERWDGWTPENGFQTPDMNSFNHYSYGSIGAWMVNTVAGIDIDPEQPGYKHAILRPQPGGGLQHTRAQIETLYGALSSAWRIEGDTFKWTITVPPNTTATAYLPFSGGVYDLAPGTHALEDTII